MTSLPSKPVGKSIEPESGCPNPDHKRDAEIKMNMASNILSATINDGRFGNDMGFKVEHACLLAE